VGLATLPQQRHNLMYLPDALANSTRSGSASPLFPHISLSLALPTIYAILAYPIATGFLDKNIQLVNQG
jgi:hypothetical protein